MQPGRPLVLLILACTTWQAACSKKDICNCKDTGLSCDSGPNNAVACYAGNFILKVLDELVGGDEKTVQHVRLHLLPYLGGPLTLGALEDDRVDDPGCRVCYADSDTRKGLTSLRESLKPAQMKAYDELGVCYATLTERILSSLPLSADGVWIRVSPRFKKDIFSQASFIFRRLAGQEEFAGNSCRIGAAKKRKDPYRLVGSGGKPTQ